MPITIITNDSLHRPFQSRSRAMKTTLLLACTIASSTAFRQSPIPAARQRTQNSNRRPLVTSIQMKPNESNDAAVPSSERRRTSLSAATLQSIDESPLVIDARAWSAVTRVASASLLVTGNTVGSSMFVLPEAVGSVGMAWGSAVFVGVYLFNLLSGLMLADVAINLHETSDCEVPSSFKDFADCAMQHSTAGNAIGAASLLMNSCFLSYGMVQVGSFASTALPDLQLDPTLTSGCYAILLSVAFLSNISIESIANTAVMVLFASFASLLLPSLASVSSPAETFYASGSSDGRMLGAFLSDTVPLIVSTMIYQNIVPSVTKLLDFDRTKSYVAIAVGSLLPMLMYVAWCFAVLGGGLDASLESGMGGMLFAAFTASSFVGSSIGCVLSLAEEYESILSEVASKDEDGDSSCAIPTTEGGFSTPAVVMSVLPPAAVALAVSSGDGGAFTAPLHLSGAVIAPFLYGLLPVMLFKSMQSDVKNEDTPFKDVMPQVLLGAGTVGLVGNELFHDVTNWLS